MGSAVQINQLTSSLFRTPSTSKHASILTMDIMTGMCYLVLVIFKRWPAKVFQMSSLDCNKILDACRNHKLDSEVITK